MKIHPIGCSEDDICIWAIEGFWRDFGCDDRVVVVQPDTLGVVEAGSGHVLIEVRL